MTKCAIPLAVAWTALYGCAETGSNTDSTTVLETLPSGAVLATSVPAANASPTWTLAEELRVGSLEDAGPDAFSYLKGLAALEGGGFAVLESQAQEVRVFGPDGAHLATHGGKGQGPGEFIDANGLMLDADGRLWVPDTRNGRMSVLDPEDGFVESFPFADGNFGWIWNGAMVDGDRIYRPWSAGNVERLHVYDLTMTLVDSITLASDQPEDEEYDPQSNPCCFYQEINGGYMMYGIPFFAADVGFFDSRGGLWSTSSGDPAYRLFRWEPGGDTTLVVENRRPAVPVTTAERDSVVGGMRRMLADQGVSREWDWSRIPNLKPAVEAIFESVEGNLWVRTPSTEGSVLFDVYSRDGSYLGAASSELDLNIADRVAPAVRGDVAWLIATDELDVPYVVRARITPTDSDGA